MPPHVSQSIFVCQLPEDPADSPFGGRVGVGLVGIRAINSGEATGRKQQ